MHTNIEMEAMLAAAERHLDRRDMVGYAAARNTRVLADELREFHAFRDDLVREHGEKVLDADGNPTGNVELSPSMPGYGPFLAELGKLAGVEHDPKVFTIPYSEAIGVLSGTELLELDWMFHEED